MTNYTEIIDGMIRSDTPSMYWGDHTFDELEITKSLTQITGDTVFSHTMKVIDVLEVKNVTTLLSGLFHDLGKTAVQPRDSNIRFPGHAEQSARIAAIKLQEWSVPSPVSTAICNIIATHMFDIRGASQEKTIRKFVTRVGYENIDSWFILRVADSLAYTAHRQYFNTLILPFRIAVDKYLAKWPRNNQITSVRCSDITGGIQIEGKDVV